MNTWAIRAIGHFSKCGYKFETWYDMIWMEKMISEHDLYPEPFKPITELREWEALLENMALIGLCLISVKIKKLRSVRVRSF